MKKMHLPEYQLLITGQWVAATAGKTSGADNPASDGLIAMIAEADETDVSRAVQAARAALAGPWGQMGAAERGRILQRLAALLREHAEEPATLECLDAGKPVSAVQRQDAPAAFDALEDSAGRAGRAAGEAVPARAAALTCTVREPLGAVAAIAPWPPAGKTCPQGAAESVKNASSNKVFKAFVCAA